MAWSLLAHHLDSGTNAVTTTAINSTGADLILVFASSYNGVAAPTIADSASNTWLQDKQVSDASSFSYLTLWRAQGPVITSATHTATVTATGGVPTAIIMVFSGSDGGTYDVINVAAANTANFNTGSVTPGANGELVISGVVGLGAGMTSIAATSPQTLIDHVNYVASTTFGTATSYYVQPTAGAINPAFTWTSAANAQGVTVVYKPASAATATYVAEDDRRLPPRRPPHFCQPSEPAPVYWPYKQSALHLNGASSSTTIVAAFPNKVGTSVGGLILASISWTGSSGDTVSLTDDQGNTYIQPPALSQFDSGSSTWWIGAYCVSPAGNPQTLTATISTSRTFGRLIVDEFSGPWAFRDQASSNSQTGVSSGTDTVISPTVTPQANRELVYGSTFQNSGSTIANATGTGYNQATNFFNFATEFRVQGAASAVTATWSPSPTPTGATYLTYIATFSQAQVQLAVPETAGQLAPLRRPYQRFAAQSEVGPPPAAAVVAPSPLEQEQQRLPPRRPEHRSQEAEVAPIRPPQVRVAPEEVRLPIGRSWHRVPAETEVGLPAPAAPIVFKPIGEDDRRLPPSRPWHRLADVDQGGWPFTVVATVGRLVTEEPGRLPPRRPYHRTPDVDQGAWPFSVAPLNTKTYLPEDEQHLPHQRPWHSMLTAHADLQVPPAAPTSLFYAYGQAGARSVG